MVSFMVAMCSVSKKSSSGLPWRPMLDRTAPRKIEENDDTQNVHAVVHFTDGKSDVRVS
ncbi:hypothetical protein DPMN_104828 [Dreissena polymorpha]|uniref:Uncharacterized protein n=1 Tax=Dreissena polymorpha TaxID=45954 RepID=A0A9D4K355_DREPO|nr:hypothetical protein DPMN_104828 [Dreissena polymorpha]